jgi:hypothetical protein
VRRASTCTYNLKKNKTTHHDKRKDSKEHQKNVYTPIAATITLSTKTLCPPKFTCRRASS